MDAPVHTHWHDLYRYRFLVVLTAAAAGGMAWLFSTMVEPVFEAKTTFYIPANAVQPVYTSATPDGTEGILLPIPEEKTAALDVGILRGREVMGALSEELGIDVNALRERTDVVVNGEFMIDVFVRGPDAEEDARIANAIPGAYRAFHDNVLRERAAGIAEVLRGQVETLRAEAERLDAALREARLTSRSSADGDALGSVQARRSEQIAVLAGLDGQIEEVTAQIASYDAALEGEGAAFAEGRTVESTPALDLLLERVLDLRVDLAAVTDGPRSPRRQSIEEQIREIETQMVGEREQLAAAQAKPAGSLYERLRLERTLAEATLEGLNARREVAEGDLDTLDARFSEIVGQVSDADRLSTESARIRAELANVEANLASAELRSRNAEAPLVVTEAATVPTRPVFPLPILNTVVAALTGLLLGAYYALLVGHARRARDVRAAAGAPIPHFTDGEITALREIRRRTNGKGAESKERMTYA